MKESVNKLDVALGALVLVAGFAIAFSTLSRGVWLDEFFTYGITASGVTGQEFFRAMAGEPAPLLHNGLVFLAQAIGLTTFAALRSLNILGVLLVLCALWFSFHRRIVSASAACVVIALFASSPIFLDYFAELRAYSLLYSSSIATALCWLVLERATAQRVRRSDLFAYGFCLSVFVNLHYFGTVLGGLLTFALIIEASARGRIRLAAQIALVSIVSALPALATAWLQVHAGLTPSYDSWITGNTTSALRTMIHVAFDSVGHNLIAVASGLMALLLLFKDTSRAAELRGLAILGTSVGFFFVIVLVFNVRQPIVVARYLFAAGGVFVVGLALLCVQPRMPSWNAAAICVFALAFQANAVRTHQFRRDGWRTSAQFVAQQAASCPATQVFVDPFVYQNVVESEARLWRDGYRYYANEFHLTDIEVGRGASVTASGSCPSLIWLEHVWRVQGFPIDRLLVELGITVTGNAEVKYVGSGAVIVVR